MARREQYNPLLKSYPDSVKINAVSLGAETLYTRLIAASDDAGRYYGDAGMVLGKLFTARMVAGEVNRKMAAGWLSELESVGLISRYTVNNVVYLEIVNVFRTLRKDKTPQILYPERVPETVTDPLRNRDDAVTESYENVALDPYPDVDRDVDRDQTKTQYAMSGKPDGADSVRLVFAHYRTYHPKAHPTPTSKGKAWVLIADRLCEGYSVPDLCSAIDGIHKSPFHCGQNDKGAKYQALELCMRSGDKVAGFMEHATTRAGPVLSEKSMRTQSAIDQFVLEREGSRG